MEIIIIILFFLLIPTLFFIFKDSKEKRIIRTIIIVLVLLFIPAFFIIRFFRVRALMNYEYFFNNILEQKGQFIYTPYDNNNIPDFAKDFAYTESPEITLEDYYFAKQSYDRFDEEKFFEKIQPDNLEEYQTKLAASILELMGKEKTDKYPSAKDTENYKALPDFKIIRNTATYWRNLSLLFAKKGDYKTSLLLLQGLFYLEQEIITSCRCTGSFTVKSLCSICTAGVYEYILVWASRPHYECKELSKNIAKDLLKFVDINESIKRNIEFKKYLIDNSLIICSKKTSLVSNKVLESSYYKELTELFINEPLKFESKPFKEVKDEYEKYNKKVENFWKKKSISSIITYDYCINIDTLNNYLDFSLYPEKSIVTFVFRVMSFPTSSLYNIKKSNEQKLGEIELASIALLINSYVCENNKLPQNIEELEKWFGQKLPVNRADYFPYEIEAKDMNNLILKGASKQVLFKFLK